MSQTHSGIACFYVRLPSKWGSQRSKHSTSSTSIIILPRASTPTYSLLEWAAFSLSSSLYATFSSQVLPSQAPSPPTRSAPTSLSPISNSSTTRALSCSLQMAHSKPQLTPNHYPHTFTSPSSTLLPTPQSGLQTVTHPCQILTSCH